MVPIRTVLPLDTDIETSVFGLGTIKIPIRAQLPIDLMLPIVGKIRGHSVSQAVKPALSVTASGRPIRLTACSEIRCVTKGERASVGGG